MVTTITIALPLAASGTPHTCFILSKVEVFVRTKVEVLVHIVHLTNVKKRKLRIMSKLKTSKAKSNGLVGWYSLVRNCDFN